MIDNIIKMLKITDYYGVSNNIEIAKGRHKIPTTVKEALKQAKREIIFKYRGNGRA